MNLRCLQVCVLLVGESVLFVGEMFILWVKVLFVYECVCFFVVDMCCF